MEPLEVWKQVHGYGGHYEASNLGRIRSKDRIVIKRHNNGKMMEQFYPSKILLQHKSDKWGHLSVHIGVDSKRYTVAVHTLVLLAFSGIPPKGCEACHSNGVASDNRESNLRWDTHFNNNQDRKKHGHYPSGANHPMAKITLEQVAGIRAGEITRKQSLKELGISGSQYHRIKTGESWKGIAA